MRKLAALFATTLTVGGALIYFAGPEDKETTASKIEASIGPRSGKFQTARPEVQAAISSAITLYDRRAKGDEPTKEEWQSAEAAVDALRATQDSEELQKIDRMLEISDAEPKYIEEETAKRL